MLQMHAFDQVALISRHWFELDLDTGHMEHGSRLELRQRESPPHRGTESAAQVVAVDTPVWRVDIFDRYDDRPGTYRAAHYHPQFAGVEPSPRAWDEVLTRTPWRWLLSNLRNPDSPLLAPMHALDGPAAEDVACNARYFVGVAMRFAPTTCSSISACYRSTRDAVTAVQKMVELHHNPPSIDHARMAPWLQVRDPRADVTG